jgi:hypothetical protein
MALQSSGAISLDDIHVEAGGTTGTLASINDSDIRALINKTADTTMRFNEWYFASSGTDVTVTQGIKYQTQSTVYGFEATTPTGSVSPTSVTGNTITTTIKSIYRLNSPSGLSFTIDLHSSSPNAIPANEFTSFSFTANNTLTTLLTSEASTTTISNGFIRRWVWSSSYGLDSTEIANITTEWDGSGNVDVRFNL